MPALEVAGDDGGDGECSIHVVHVAVRVHLNLPCSLLLVQATGQEERQWMWEEMQRHWYRQASLCQQ